MVTAEMVQPFLRAVEATGKNPNPLLRKLGLTREDIANAEKFIPGQTWYDFCEAAAALGHDPHLGYEIGARMALDHLPNMDILRLPHATLGELLNALVIDARRITSLATYRVGTNGVTAQLETQRVFKPARPPAQVDGFFVGFMLRILRLCTDTAWHAGRVTVTVSDPKAVPLTEHPVVIYKDPQFRGAQFTFPAVWLLHRTDGAARQTLHVQREHALGFRDVVRTLLKRHLDQPGLTLERFSELTSMSPDRIKRSLADHGTSYAKERDQLRVSRAKMLLATTSESIGSIGSRVGHPDSPGFTRRFCRWTGDTPSGWRAKNHLV